MAKPSKLKLVKAALTDEQREELIDDVKSEMLGAAIQKKWDMSRQEVRTLRAKHRPKITLQSRAKLNPVKPPAPKPPPLPARPQSPIIRRFIGAGCLVVAIVFAGGGAFMNYRFGSSFGQEHDSRLVLGAITIAIDLGALFLFAAASYLREQRDGLWVAAFLIWLVCVVLSVCAGLGYWSSNTGDSLQSRDTVIQHRKTLVAELSRAEAWRSKITEGRDPQVIEQQIQIEQGKVPSKNWASSAYCTSVTLSGPFCMALNQERAAKAAAEQRIELDARIRKLSTEIAALPPVSAKDPPAEQIAAMAFGFVTPEQARSYIVRCLAIVPGFASILLAIARTLLR